MRSLFVLRLVAAVTLSLSLTHPAVAADVTWTDGTGSWSVVTNWSSNPNLPAAADDVTINVAGVQTITHGSGNDVINSLSMPGDDILSVTGGILTVTNAFGNAANTTINGGTLVLNGASTMGSLTLSAGFLSGTGTVVVGGASTWTAGGMSGAGTTQFDSTLGITGQNIKLISTNRSVTLNGTTSWSGNTAINGNAVTLSNGTINNAGTFNDANTFDTQFSTAGVSAFNNSGTYTKTGNTRTLSQVAFNNTGTVNVNAGRLLLETGTSTGTFTVADGAVLEFGFGTHTLNSATVAGAGTLEVGGGNAVINGGTYSAPLLFSSGFISGTGATFTAPAVWTGGAITGVGTTVFGSTLQITGATGKAISGTRVVTLNGTTTWDGNTGNNNGTISFSNGTVNNVGTFNDANPFNSLMDTAGVNAFNNSGTYNKNVNATTVIEIPFNNTGTVNVNAGRLHLESGTSTGTFTVASGATLGFVFGTHTLNNATITGAGTFQVGAGNVVINDGTYSAPLLLSSGSISGTTSTFTAPATWTGGTIGGAGTTTFNNTLAITGPDGKAIGGTRVVTLNNVTTWGGNTAALNNTISWSTGTVNNTGTFNDTNTFNSLMDTLGVNAFNNGGTYNKSGNATTTIEVPFNNTGTANVNAGRLHLQGGTDTGAFTIASGATLDFVFGIHTLNNASVTGAGTLEVGGGNVVINGGTYTAPLLLSSGSISGTTSTFTAPAVWTGGVIGGAGTTTFDNNLDITGPNGKGLNGTRVVNLNGTTTWGGNTAPLNNGIFWNNGTINNAGTFNDTNTFNSVMDTLGVTLFNNTGTYNKTGNAFTSIEVTFQNSGTINAQAGLLGIFRGVQGPTGTIQIGPNGALDIGAGVGGASTVGTLLHNGNGATSLQLNLNNVTVFTDYNNAHFGVGNSFNARANVGGTGQIRAAGDVAQAIAGTGVTGGGTATPTLTIGNVHVGANTISYQVANSGATGPSLRGAIQTINGGNITDARLSGSGVTPGNWGPVAPGTASGNLDVVFTASSSGLLAPLVGQTVHVVNNFANVGSQNLDIVLGAGAAAYNLAAGNATPSPVSLANQRIGGTATQSLTVTNTAPAGAFTEVLNASFGASTGDATNNGGAISGGLNTGGVSGGGSNAAAMSVGVDTSASGVRSGTVTVNYVSNGNGTSGLGNTSVGSQVISVSGNVFQAAVGQLNNPTSLDFGTVQVGQSVSQKASISNIATGAAGFVEDLHASFGTATGTGASRISGTGSITGLVAGQTDANTLVVSVDTSTAGSVNGSIPINFVTAGAVNGVSNGLGTASVGSASFGVLGTISAQVVDQASPVLNTPTVDLGNVRINTASPTQFVSLTNQATGNAQAALNASISGTPPVTASGGFTLLAPGGTNATSLQVGIDTSAAGHRSGTATIALVSDASNVGNCAPSCQVTLPSQNVSVSANVFRLASPQVNTPGINLVARVGAVSPSAAISITNVSPDAFTEGLTVTRGATPAGFTSSGSITNLAAGATSSNAIQVSLNTATAGTFGGNQDLNFVSTGTGTTGAQDVSVGTGSVPLSGKVYQTAQAQINTSSPINFGIVHVGDTVAARTISITNAAPVTTLNDVLIGSVGAGPSPFSASGNLGAGLGAGQTDSSSLKVALDTSSAGVFTGQAGLSLASHNADLADLPLATSPIALQAQVNNFADPVFSKIAGSGSFTGSGRTYVLDFGAIPSALGPFTANLALANALLGGPQDALGGAFTFHADDFVATGFQSFDNLEAGQTLTGLNVAFGSRGHEPGDFSGVIILHPFSTNESGLFDLPDVVITLQGSVFIETPEPGTGLLITAGVLALVAVCRRRRARD